MCFRVFDQNFLDDDVVSNRFISSEQAAFPDENLYNAQRRSKVWRSNGFWNIESGSNGIVFEETTSTPLTASVTVAEYSSDDAFFAAIKSALEAVGASTYTVDRDSATGRIQITSDLGGGGGIFNVLWTDASSTLADTIGFDTGTDDTGSDSYLADTLKIHTSQWIKWDFGISTNPTAFIMVDARNDVFEIGPGATIKLQGNETDVWTAPSYEKTLTYDDSNIFEVDEDGLHTEALRFWRLQIVEKDNPNVYIQLGSVFLGDFYEPTRGKAQFPLQSQLTDFSTTIFAEGGQTFSDIRQPSQEFGVRWFGLTKTEVERFIEIFDDFRTARPFFVMMDKDAVFSSTANYALRYVKFSQPPLFQLVSPNNFEMNWRLREEL